MGYTFYPEDISYTALLVCLEGHPQKRGRNGLEEAENGGTPSPNPDAHLPWDKADIHGSEGLVWGQIGSPLPMAAPHFCPSMIWGVHGSAHSVCPDEPLHSQLWGIAPLGGSPNIPSLGGHIWPPQITSTHPTQHVRERLQGSPNLKIGSGGGLPRCSTIKFCRGT